MTTQHAEPVLDGNGNPVNLPSEMVPDAAVRLFFSGRVPASECPHYIARSEARAGLTTCERCPSGGAA